MFFGNNYLFIMAWYTSSPNTGFKLPRISKTYSILLWIKPSIRYPLLIFLNKTLYVFLKFRPYDRRRFGGWVSRLFFAGG